MEIEKGKSEMEVSISATGKVLEKEQAKEEEGGDEEDED